MKKTLRVEHDSGKKIKWVMKPPEKIRSTIGKRKKVLVYFTGMAFGPLSGYLHIVQEMVFLECEDNFIVKDIADIICWMYDPDEFLKSLNKKA